MAAMRRWERAAVLAATLVVVTTGCFDDDVDPTAPSSTPAAADTATPGSDPAATAPPTTTPAGPVARPAGVAWSGFVDETSAAPDLPVGAVATATGPGGSVAVGRISASSGALGSVNDLSDAAIWLSGAGGWEEIDPRLENGTAALYDVAAWQGGFVAVGFHADAYERVANAIVLTSTDGRNWGLVAVLPSQWSGWGSRVRVTPSGAVLVEVLVEVCSEKSEFVNALDPITAPSLWSAVAPTGTYTQIPSTAFPALSPEIPTPSDQVGCFYFANTPEDQRRERYGAKLGDIGVIGDRLAVLDPDASALSVTSDLTNWSRIELPEPVTNPLGALLYGSPEGRITVVAISQRPLGAGYVAGATDPNAWVSTVWEETPSGELLRIPPWRPLRSENKEFVRIERRDATVRIIAAAPVDLPAAFPQLQVATSDAAQLDPQPSCTPGAGADCSFIALTGSQLAGADLAAINLYGATLSGVNLDGANLAYANLQRATIDGSSLVGTNLTLSSAFAVRVNASNLTSAVLFGADVSSATFTGTNMSGATFANATLDSALTDGASLCPDGAAPGGSDSLVLRTACRLG